MFEFHAKFLNSRDSEELFAFLLRSAQWQVEAFRIFGKNVLAPRRTAWFGETNINYRYTGIDHFGSGWPLVLATLRAKVGAFMEQEPNFVILNHYRNGEDHMGWHSDDERNACPQIASLSLGATRRFRIDQGATVTPTSIDLDAGSLLIFDGRQRHQLAKTKRPCAPRINLTFRSIIS